MIRNKNSKYPFGFPFRHLFAKWGPLLTDGYKVIAVVLAFVLFSALFSCTAFVREQGTTDPHLCGDKLAPAEAGGRPSSLVPPLGGAGLVPRPSYRWAVHDMSRPRPPVVTPAEQPGQPPSSAIVLFDGKDLSQWVCEKDGRPARWKVENGYMEVVKGTGSIRTRQVFGDCQLHLEWTSQVGAKGKSQKRSNSGVFLMGKYEVQVLDSYKSETYADGQAAAIYGQYPPMFNACRKPGRWQSYDIIFHRPWFNKDGRVVRPAYITVLHNGILVQDNVEIQGATVHKKRAAYHPHADRLPLMLQDHGDPVRYRNIWLIESSSSSSPSSRPSEGRDSERRDSAGLDELPED